MRAIVIERCYWPLLELIKKLKLPLGIEATGYTLEVIDTLDPRWLTEFRALLSGGICEFIGSGYSQIIGPLVPARVNKANLELGNRMYDRLLGLRPEIALVNEQAYSSGLVNIYLEAGYKAIVMEWDNPFSRHPEWDPRWRYLPQYACGTRGERIKLVWNKSIAFQKFQRYAHGEMELEEYLDYLSSHLDNGRRAFPLYGNDAEIFDFRPGRYHTEGEIHEDGEWLRIERLFERLLADVRFKVVSPSSVLDLIGLPGAGNELRLESPDQPTPVKKQGKYNITRWAVTGRDDLGINTACWRIYHSIKDDPKTTEDDWRELCYLWSSDFRTHITGKRWKAYIKHLHGVVKSTVGAVGFVHDFRCEGCSSPSDLVTTSRNGRCMVVETDSVRVRLNCRRGLAIDALWFKGVSDFPMVGTLPHGYYDDISLGADYYTGHVVMESPGRPKVTDLEPVDPSVASGDSWIDVKGRVSTPLGPLHKKIRVFCNLPKVELEYWMEWEKIPLGALRLGHVTLNPEAFNRSSLYYRTHNGGFEAETFPLSGTSFSHGDPVSFLVSASHGIGITEGVVELGDGESCVRVLVDKRVAALIGLLSYREVGDSYFCRLTLSAREMDDTQMETTGDSMWDGRVLFSIEGQGVGGIS